ncbi:hypothetical protein Nmel_003252 [Mimus melanotis]
MNMSKSNCFPGKSLHDQYMNSRLQQETYAMKLKLSQVFECMVLFPTFGMLSSFSQIFKYIIHFCNHSV